jgi:hypothetical protein
VSTRLTEPLHHVERPSPPWRGDQGLTECGIACEGLGERLWTRDQLRDAARNLGAQRLSMQCCMTCLNTAQRWPSWDQDPVEALGREIHGRTTDLFRLELWAIAALVDENRERFDAFLAVLAETPTLAEQRQRRRRRMR